MISIIICSINKQLLADTKKNISETIGVPYEIIDIDNTQKKYGICKAYNEGGAKAKYPFLCFMHEDITFETKNWGQLICNYFLSNKNIGLLGAAGGDAKSVVPSSWSIPIVSNEINIVQHDKLNPKTANRIIVTGNQTKSKLKKVVALDGVWLCTTKEVFDQFKFDENTFTGFHGYDIDYSLQVNTKYDVYVIFDIILHHYSQGNPDKEWMESAILLSNKWKKKLPVSIYQLPKQGYNLHHWQSLQVFIKHLIRLKYKLPSIVKFYLIYSFTPFFTVRRFLSTGKFLIVNMYGGRK